MTDRLAADRLVIVAPKEWEVGKVRIKNLASRDEQELSVADLAAHSTSS